MSIWIRSSGSEIVLSDTNAMIEFAESQGWKKKKAKRKAKEVVNSGDSK